MGMAFAKVVTHGWLVDQMEMTSPILLPFMGVSVKVGPRMLPVRMPHKVDAIIDNAVPILMILLG